jgi:hypothetical protein
MVSTTLSVQIINLHHSGQLAAFTCIHARGKNVMQTKLIVTAAALLGLAAPAHAELFSIGADFTIAFENSPTSETDTTVKFLPGTTQLVDGGNLNLTISLANGGGGKEWVVLNYQTAVPGTPLSLGGQDWSVNPFLPAAVAVNLTGDYYQWQGADGSNIPQTGGIFGQTLMTSPVPGLTGSGEGSLGYVAPFGGPGLLPGLLGYADPFQIVLNGLPAAEVEGYTSAFEFSAQSPVPEASTWAMMLVGFAGLGYAGYRKAGKARLAA